MPLGLQIVADDTGVDLTKYYGGQLPQGYAWAVTGVDDFNGVGFKERDGNPWLGEVGPAVNATGSALNESAIRNAIAGFYRTYYRREPDAAGLNFWVSVTLSGSHTLADVERAFQTSPDAAVSGGAGSQGPGAGQGIKTQPVAASSTSLIPIVIGVGILVLLFSK